jgi:hypothetical protein
MPRWVLAEDIGIETLGGVLTPLLLGGECIPCTTRQVFSTAEDNQRAVTIVLAQGRSGAGQPARRLGRFDLEGIAPAPAGTPQIEVSVTVDAEGTLAVSAVDTSTRTDAGLRIGTSEEARVRLRDADTAAGGLAPAPTLARALWVEDEAGNLHPLFEAGATLPAVTRRTIPTLRDAQTELPVRILEGPQDRWALRRDIGAFTFRMASNTAAAGRVGMDLGVAAAADGAVVLTISPGRPSEVIRTLPERVHVRLAGPWLDAAPPPRAAAADGTALPVVFVSHAAVDGARAMQMVAGLEGSGRARCWIAPRDVRAGHDYRAEIMQAIRNASHCVLLLTEASNQSAHVLREVSLADQFSKRILPVRLDAATLRPELEYLLSGVHWTPWDALEADFTRLL